MLVLKEGKSQAAIHTFEVLVNESNLKVQAHQSPGFIDVDKQDVTHKLMLKWYRQIYGVDLRYEQLVSY